MSVGILVSGIMLGLLLIVLVGFGCVLIKSLFVFVVSVVFVSGGMNCFLFVFFLLFVSGSCIVCVVLKIVGNLFVFMIENECILMMRF